MEMLEGVTVVTPLFKDDNLILDTAESISPYLANDFRWIVKTSLDILTPCLSKLSHMPHTKVVFRADSGLYEGLNQALSYVDTRFFSVLGAGDRLAEEGVKELKSCLGISNCPKILFFSIFHQAKNFVFRPRPNDITKRMSCPHPGTIMDTQSALMLGGFDLRYEIASDYDLICRFIKEFKIFRSSDSVIAFYKGNGISMKRADEGLVEEALIRKRVFNIPVSFILEDWDNAE